MLNSMSETKKERSFTPSASGLVCRLVGEACRGDSLRGAHTDCCLKLYYIIYMYIRSSSVMCHPLLTPFIRAIFLIITVQSFVHVPGGCMRLI